MKTSQRIRLRAQKRLAAYEEGLTLSVGKPFFTYQTQEERDAYLQGVQARNSTELDYTYYAHMP